MKMVFVYIVCLSVWIICLKHCLGNFVRKPDIEGSLPGSVFGSSGAL